MTHSVKTHGHHLSDLACLVPRKQSMGQLLVQHHARQKGEKIGVYIYIYLYICNSILLYALKNIHLNIFAILKNLRQAVL